MILQQLKEETAPLHQEVEQDNLARFIMDGTITQTQYDDLLRQNFMVYKGVEDFVNTRYELLPAALRPFAGFDKTNSLAKDISNISGVPLPAAFKVIGSRNLPTVIGKLYVVEGSMVGGMMMSKKLRSCKNLNHIIEHYFFSGDTFKSAERWRSFKDVVNTMTFTEQEIAIAVESAKDTFLLFKKPLATRTHQAF